MGAGGKGCSLHDSWWYRARSVSSSIPVAIHDRNMPEAFDNLQPLSPHPDDAFTELCSDIKRGFDDQVNKK